MDSEKRVEKIRKSLEEVDYFQGKGWRVTPHPFILNDSQKKILKKLGNALHSFQKACNLLYRKSAEGSMPSFVSEWIDAGKPPELVKRARSKKFKNQLARVIRPDLVLGEKGFGLCEIDAVPGGIGMSAWLQEHYSKLGEEKLIGGSNGMREGFKRVFPSGELLISEEAGEYRSEFEWLIGKERVRSVEKIKAKKEDAYYRFFECFDWEKFSVEGEEAFDEIAMTPPLKPYLEEKLWLALFWLAPLRCYWRDILGEKQDRFLQEIIPYSWVMSPEKLPVHGAIPRLEIPSWEAMGEFSQKERELVLKISGFSEKAWGSRGVWVGSDMAASDWKVKIGEALSQFSSHPHLLQKFYHGALVEHPYWDEKENKERVLRGRARISPYYFIEEDQVDLGGVLVTLCPSDKKLLHGMRDAIICPAS